MKKGKKRKTKKREKWANKKKDRTNYKRNISNNILDVQPIPCKYIIPFPHPRSNLKLVL